MQSLKYHTRESFVGVKIGLFTKIFLTNIYRYSETVIGICTDCSYSLFAKIFLTNSFLLPVWFAKIFPAKIFSCMVRGTYFNVATLNFISQLPDLNFHDGCCLKLHMFVLGSLFDSLLVNKCILLASYTCRYYITWSSFSFYRCCSVCTVRILIMTGFFRRDI